MSHVVIGHMGSNPNSLEWLARSFPGLDLVCTFKISSLYFSFSRNYPTVLCTTTSSPLCWPFLHLECPSLSSLPGELLFTLKFCSQVFLSNPGGASGSVLWAVVVFFLQIIIPKIICVCAAKASIPKSIWPQTSYFKNLCYPVKTFQADYLGV